MDLVDKNKKHAIRYSEEELAKAKQMYLEYLTVTEIALQTGIGRNTLSYHINKTGSSWQIERELQKAELLGKVSSAKKADFANMAISSIEIIKRALADLAKRDQAPTVAEAKRATEILESLDRITRLDDGAPTEITAEKPFVVANIRKRMLIDPFAKDAEVVETVEEIENESEEDVEE